MLHIFRSGLKQARFRYENQPLCNLCDYNDLQHHPRIHKQSQNHGWLEHKAIYRNQDATCQPNESRNLTEKKWMKYISFANWGYLLQYFEDLFAQNDV